VAALRFGDRTVHALRNAVLMFELLPAGFSNRQLRAHVAQLLGQSEKLLTPGRISYNLRRLRLHGFIERIPKSHRYRLTDFRLRIAMFATRVWNRVLRPGLGMVLPSTSTVPNPLSRTFDKLTSQIHDWVHHA
jgi:hypothetical protein